MLNNIDGIKIQFFKIFDILKEKISFSELLLNTLFIILLFIITSIIYWDTINSKVAQNSRCKKQLELSSSNKNTYNILATDKNNKPLFNISYDTSQNNTNVECACNVGTFMNNFTKIPVRNLKNNTNSLIDKSCTCDKYYDIGYNNEKVIYQGDPGIIRYMNNNNNTDFFDSITYSPYN